MDSIRDSASVEGKNARIIEVDEEQIRSHVDGIVRATVEETLNALLEAEADQLCGRRVMSAPRPANLWGRPTR